MPGLSYCKGFRSLLLRLCDVFRALINSLYLLILKNECHSSTSVLIINASKTGLCLCHLGTSDVVPLLSLELRSGIPVMVEWLAVQNQLFTRLSQRIFLAYILTDYYVHDPNTKKVQTNVYLFWHGHIDLPSTKQATKTKPKQDKFFLSFFIVFKCLSVVSVSFCGLTKGISSKICICVSVSN